MPEPLDPNVEKWNRRWDTAHKFISQYYSVWNRLEGWVYGELPLEIQAEYTKAENQHRSARMPLLPSDIFEDMEAKVLGGTLFSTDKWLDFAFRQGMDWLEKYMDKNRHLIIDQLEHEEYEFKTQMRQIWFNWWTKMTGLAWPEWVFDEETDYEGAALLSFDPRRWKPSPMVDHRNRPVYHILEKVIYFKDIKRMAATNRIKGESVRHVMESLRDFDNSWVDASMVDMDLDAAKTDTPAEKNNYPVMLMCGIDGEEMFYWANRKVFLWKEDRRVGPKKVPTRDLMIQKLDLMPRFGRVLGTCPAKIVEDSWISHFNIKNMETDNLLLVTGPQFATDADNMGPYIQGGAGKVHTYPPGRKFEPILFKNDAEQIAASSMRVEAEVRKYLNLESLSVGDNPPRRETLGTNIMLQQNAQKKLAYTISLVEEFIGRGIRQMLKLNQKNWPQTYTRKYYQGFKITREEIKPELLPVLKGLKNATSRELFGAMAMDIMERVAKIPQIAQFLNYKGFSGWREIFKRVLMGLGEDDPDSILPENEAIVADAERENFLMMQYGIDIPVHQWDDPTVHIPTHQRQMEEIPILIQQGQMSQEEGNQRLAVFGIHISNHQKMMPQEGGASNGSTNGQIPTNIMDLIQKHVPEIIQPQKERVV